ncbi:MAG: DUF4407 domain-containing protein [Verrucomicrobiales bacterium]|nr:DUF4407 domain-containing protein [Verrucomicrobiales bacterium]
MKPDPQPKHLFFWLAGAGSKSLETCPDWEQRKYVAFGATVLVPTVFAFIACAYALSTITDNWRIIVPVSVVWGFIILTIDRALLSTYRSYQPLHRKFNQFMLRFVVAILMGLTISHPLTLLLFKDTISSVIEKDRKADISAAREEAVTEKTKIETKIANLEENIASHRSKWDQTFDAKFLVANEVTDAKDATSELDAATQKELDQRIQEETGPLKTQLASLGLEMSKSSLAYKTMQGELDHWQVEFEREVNGQRSGIVGLGPRAKSIRDDQLAWRRTEAKRLGSVVDSLSKRRNDLKSSITSTELNLKAEYVGIAAERNLATKAEADRVAGLKRKVQQEQAGQFVGQQNAIRATIATQIDSRLEELKRLQADIAALGVDEQERVDAIKAEPRRDLLTQTLALHKLFDAGEKGGQFAISAYVILALLFMLIDTIPLIVKFFSKPGPYDTLVDCEEVRYEKERQTFLKSYHHYMDELSDGRMLHLTQNKPLERALVEGVDRSRAAKEFLEQLMELEQSFEERIAQERAQGRSPERIAMLEDMAQAYYDEMRTRMESFFEEKKPARRFS